MEDVNFFIEVFDNTNFHGNIIKIRALDDNNDVKMKFKKNK
jgi:hypothetical protein